MFLEGLEHPQVSHATRSTSAKRDSNLDAAQVVDHPFDSVHERPVLLRTRLGKGDFEITSCQFEQLGRQGRYLLIAAEDPNNTDFVLPAGRTRFNFS